MLLEDLLQQYARAQEGRQVSQSLVQGLVRGQVQTACWMCIRCIYHEMNKRAKRKTEVTVPSIPYLRLPILWTPYFKRVDFVTDVEARKVRVARRVLWDCVELETGWTDRGWWPVWCRAQWVDRKSVEQQGKGFPAHRRGQVRL